MDYKKLQGEITRGAITGGIVGLSLMYGSGKDMTTALYGGLAGGGASIASDLAVDYVLPHLTQPKDKGMSASEHMILQPALTGLAFMLGYQYVAHDYRMENTRLFVYGAGSELLSHYTGNVIHGKNDDPYE